MTNEVLHLDERRWTALLARTLPVAERAAVMAHLDGECTTCEEYLAGLYARGQVDALDGLVDTTLIDMKPAVAAAVDDLAFERVRRAMRSPRRRGWWLTGIGTAALAAGLLLFVGVGRETPEPGYRFKGAASPAARAQLEVLVVSPAALPPTPLPVAEGANVTVGDQLVFRLLLDQPACVQLWKRSGDGGSSPSALLDAPRCLPAGAHVVEDRGQALGLLLRAAGTLDILVTLGDDVDEAAKVPAVVDETVSSFSLKVNAKP